MAISTYIFDGATLTATLDAQGTAVPASTTRIIKSATLVNTTAAPVLCTVSLVDASAVVHPKISARAVAAGESYNCPELVGKGMSAAGQVKASGLGVSFDYTATDIV